MTDNLPPGNLPILFQGVPIPARTQVRTGYLARPGLRGAYPAVIVVPSARGLTTSARMLCQSLARYGLAVLAVDLYRGSGPADDADHDAMVEAFLALSDRRAVGDVSDAVGFVRAPQTSWSDPDRIGVLGLGDGGRFAALAAAESPEVAALALCYTPLAIPAPGDEPLAGPGLIDVLAELHIPVLGLYGKQDTIATADVDDVRSRLPGARWAIYQEAGHEFLDEDVDTYDAAAAADAVERLVRFFLGELTGALEAAG